MGAKDTGWVSHQCYTVIWLGRSPALRMCYEIGARTHAAAGLLTLFCFPGTSICEQYADTVTDAVV